MKERIAECMDLLAREKVEEFRYKLEGSGFGGDKRMEKVRSVYQAKKEPKMPAFNQAHEKLSSSFDEEDEFDSLIRRY